MSAYSAIVWARSAPLLRRADGKPDTVAHHILLALSTFASSDGKEARPSIATLASGTGYSEETVSAALRRLAAAGLISSVGRFGGTGAVVWNLNLAAERDSSVEDDFAERRDRARAKAAERARRYRERRSVTVSDTVTDDGAAERDVTPSRAVMDGTVTASETVSHGAADRDVTPSETVRHGVTTVISAVQELRPALDLPVQLPGPIPPPAGAEAPTAQTIVGEWIDRCTKRPPKVVIGQVAKHVKALLEEGIDPYDIRRGMAAWMAKGLNPSTLPSVVNEIMNGAVNPAGFVPSTADLRVAQAELLKSNPNPNVVALLCGREPRLSTTDQRMRQAQALKARFANVPELQGGAA